MADWEIIMRINNKVNSALMEKARDLRKNMTKEEKNLWYNFLSKHEKKFVRQKIIDDFIVDFYCNECKLAIELDGSQHYSEDGLKKDEIRTEKISNYGITVVRIKNHLINEDLKHVCFYINSLIYK